MLSKNKLKYIQSLARKKNREAEKVFLVEGDKMVAEALQSGLQVKLLCATSRFSAGHPGLSASAMETIEVTDDELRKLSLLQSPQNALAVVAMPVVPFSQKELENKLSLALDFIQDPGNMGTIIRLADWFGIEHLLCSTTTVDCYNPKVIQASMGAIFRVKIHYVDLPQTLAELQQQGLPTYGAFLEGENIYNKALAPQGILVMGNEGNGISKDVERVISDKIHIPSFATNGSGSESLNVSMATGICLSEFRRRKS
ncbi:RNA methyltransferase [Mangrovibacterium marinum]|uniref:TrmH family RNA methyltransferase n=1 Tax=Mangrovibacterium marinum TaxID=1639118 RepID=A0A2T5C5H8_9BACT|nr:RNA methyltransferase [Mangrovibacterium marinum]PTN10157.1 TrmH family RNA methyltransferase [Mangrovibacterium marinum]